MPSALAIMEARETTASTRIQALIDEAESRPTADDTLAALAASAQEREELGAEITSLRSQITVESARRASIRQEPAVAADQVALAAQIAAGAQPQETDKAPTPFRSLGEQLVAVAAYARNPLRAPDPRLAAIMDWERAQVAVHGASEVVGSDGGFLVQTDMASGLLGAVFTESALAQRAQTREIGAGFNGIKFNVFDETSRVDGSRYGGVRAYWLAEGGTKTASRPKMSQVELTLQKLAGMYVATDELLQDTTALESMVRPAFTSEFAFKVDDAMIRGSGAGMPLGILNADALVSVTKETGQAAASLLYENIVKMFVRLSPASQARAAWFINNDVYPALWTMTQTIGLGGVPVFAPPGVNNGSTGGLLLGRPVVPIEFASTLGTVGDIILADWNEYFLIRKGGIAEASSIHVYFDTDETAFRWVLRINGRPLRKSSLTPYKGSTTTSPFVVLQTRS